MHLPTKMGSQNGFDNQPPEKGSKKLFEAVKPGQAGEAKELNPAKPGTQGTWRKQFRAFLFFYKHLALAMIGASVRAAAAPHRIRVGGRSAGHQGWQCHFQLPDGRLPPRWQAANI